MPVHGLPVVFERRHEHALRSADGANRLQLALANAVVDRAPRHFQQARGLIDGDAPPEVLFEHLPDLSRSVPGVRGELRAFPIGEARARIAGARASAG